MTSIHVNMTMATKQEIIDYIVEYKQKHGKNVQSHDGRKRFGYGHVAKLFQNWTNALIEAGVKNVPKQEVIDYIVEYKKKHGMNLKVADAHSKFGERHINKIFSSWADALDEAGVVYMPKHEIIAYIKQYNQEHGTNMNSDDARNQFGRHHLTRVFGTWSNALIEAGVAVDRSSKTITCDMCHIEFKKLQCAIENTKYNNFCSRGCHHQYANFMRDNGTPLAYLKTQKFIYRDDEVKIVNGVRIPYKYNTCAICKNTFQTLYKNTKTCSKKCFKIIQVSAGQASQLSQPTRSKAEILFYELCCEYFIDTHVLANPQMFIDKHGYGWDMDIVIPKYRMAVAYSGKWHFEQIGTSHSLTQVQTRDKIKKKLVEEHGYVHYVVKDMGGFKPDFVYKEFHKFIFAYFIHLELLLKQD